MVGYPYFDWIQIEISSYCNASCIYCPHTAYRKYWKDRYLPVEVFNNLIPAFPKTRLIYLQGWGEPFTHPHFFEMLRLAKDAGCMVGTTSNATLLNREMIKRLVNERLDIIGFSLAGVDENNDSIRQGTRLKQVLECIDGIEREKNKCGADTPKIHIAYMLMRSRLVDLEKLPLFLGNTGASETVISSLSLVVSSEMEAETILAKDEKEYSELRNILFEVRDSSYKKGAPVHYHLVSPFPREFSCGENVGKAIVIGSNGNVAPCVMKQIPAKGEKFHYFRGRRRIIDDLAFGSITDDTMNNIFNRKAYKQFVRNFRRAKIPEPCRYCLKQSIDNLV